MALTLKDAAHSEERLLAECLMHPNAGLSEAQAVFVARSLQATGFQLTARTRRIHKVNRGEGHMKKKHMTTRKQAASIQHWEHFEVHRSDTKAVHRLARSYLALLDVVKELRATIEVMGD